MTCGPDDRPAPFANKRPLTCAVSAATLAADFHHYLVIACGQYTPLECHLRRPCLLRAIVSSPKLLACLRPVFAFGAKR